MRLFAGVLSLIACCVLGFIRAEKHKQKTLFYKNFSEFNARLKLEVEFNQSSIYSIVKELTLNTDFYQTLNRYMNNGEFVFDKKYLNQAEIDFFNDYLKIIGAGDKDSQIAYLENVDKIISKGLVLAKEDEKKYGTLNIKLGILIGLAVMIILL